MTAAHGVPLRNYDTMLSNRNFLSNYAGGYGYVAGNSEEPLQFPEREFHSLSTRKPVFTFTFTYPLIARVVCSPQMTAQPRSVG